MPSLVLGIRTITKQALEKYKKITGDDNHSWTYLQIIVKFYILSTIYIDRQW